MNGERFDNDFADTHPRIERSEWILKHHVHLAALRAQFFPAELEKIASLKTEFAAVGLDQPQEHARQRGFPAAALADDGERFSPRDCETYAIHGGEARAFRFLRENAAASPVSLAQFTHCEKSFHQTRMQRAA